MRPAACRARCWSARGRRRQVAAGQRVRRAGSGPGAGAGRGVRAERGGLAVRAVHRGAAAAGPGRGAPPGWPRCWVAGTPASWPRCCRNSVPPPAGLTRTWPAPGCSSWCWPCWRRWLNRGRWCWWWRMCTGPTPLSRDLLSFLVRNLRHAAVLLVVTFRSAELHATHPLRPLLAGLSRMAGVARVELPRLSRGQVEAQLRRASGPPARTRRHERGLPARRRDPAVHRGPGQRQRHGDPGVPWSLRDQLLGRGEGAARADPAGAACRRLRRRPRRPRAAGRGDRAR